MYNIYVYYMFTHTQVSDERNDQRDPGDARWRPHSEAERG
jgi:hypothetical protein